MSFISSFVTIFQPYAGYFLKLGYKLLLACNIEDRIGLNEFSIFVDSLNQRRWVARRQ